MQLKSRTVLPHDELRGTPSNESQGKEEEKHTSLDDEKLVVVFDLDISQREPGFLFLLYTVPGVLALHKRCHTSLAIG